MSACLSKYCLWTSSRIYTKFFSSLPSSLSHPATANNYSTATTGNSDKSKPPPEPPSADLCCMSGCPVCVYVAYADELMQYCKENGKNANEEIRKVTKDPNMQMMIKMLLMEQTN